MAYAVHGCLFYCSNLCILLKKFLTYHLISGIIISERGNTNKIHNEVTNMARMSDIKATADTLKDAANSVVSDISDARYLADEVGMWLDQLKREIDEYEEDE